MSAIGFDIGRQGPVEGDAERGQGRDQCRGGSIGDLRTIPPASNHIPPATKVVTMDQWRD
jgi:hypothetical protein